MSKQNKDHILTIRLTKALLDILQRLAEKYKQESLSATVRMVILDRNEQEEKLK